MDDGSKYEMKKLSDKAYKEAFSNRFNHVFAIIEREGFTLTDIEKNTGVLANSITHYKRGRSVPTALALFKLKLGFPRISLDYLILGRGSPFLNEDEESNAEEPATGFVSKKTQELINENERLKKQLIATNEELIRCLKSKN